MLSWVFTTRMNTVSGSTRGTSDRSHYSKLNIISVQTIKVNKKYGYAYLEEIVVKRTDEKEYMFAEADFPYLNQNDIEDLYLLKIQNKIHNINGVDEFDLINALQLYIQRIVIKKRVEDEKADEIHKFSDGTLNKIYNKLEVILRDNKLGFNNKGMEDRKWITKDRERTQSIMEKIEKTLKERRRFRRLEFFVGGRRNKTDYRLLVRPE
ncbi:hypothetical protein Tco_1323631 [Tanacetum coccineum]